MNEERLQFVQQMIAKLRNFFLTTDPVIAIGVDGGGSSTYDRKGAYEMLKELELEERRLLQGRDLLRNLAVAGFAIRRHVQFIAQCDFRCSIPNQAEYNDLVKRWMTAWSDRRNCDVAGRHSLEGLMTLVETHRITSDLFDEHRR